MEKKYYITIQPSGKIGISKDLSEVLSNKVLIAFEDNTLTIADYKSLKENDSEVDEMIDEKDLYVANYHNKGTKTKRIYGARLYYKIVQYEPNVVSLKEIKDVKKVNSVKNYLDKGLKAFEFDLTELRKKVNEKVEEKKRILEEKKTAEEKKKIISSILNNAFHDRYKRKKDKDEKEEEKTLFDL